MKFSIFIFAFMSLILASCSTVKPYQRAYLNDGNMKSGTMKAEVFEQSVFNYREGAMQSRGKKGKGGCGCN